MTHPHIRLFDGVDATAPFRFDGEPTDATPRPAEEIEADIKSAVEAGAQWVVLGSHEPTAHPELVRLLWQLDDLGARGKITTNGVRLADKALLEKLRDGGLAQLAFVFWGGTAETHDALVGTPGAFNKAIEALDLSTRINQLLVTVRFVLMASNHEEVGPFVARIRTSANRFELVRLSAMTRQRELLKAHGVSRRRALGAVQAGWEAARVSHLKMQTQGFATWPAVPNPSNSELQPADLTLLDLLRSNVPVPAAINGTWMTPLDGDIGGVWYAVEKSRSLAELGLQLAAYGCPPLDLPPSMGGKLLDHPPGVDPGPDPVAVRRDEGVPKLLANIIEEVGSGPLPAWNGAGSSARVAVVNGYCTDNVLALSTLPSLAARLAARGCEVQHHSIWEAPFNPYDNGVRLGREPDFSPRGDEGRWGYEPALVESMANTPARIAHARRQSEGWLAGLDLSGQQLVVVPGFESALAVLEHPTLPADARIVIADFHLGTGLGGWHSRFLKPGTRSMDGGWWPDERILVHGLYPRYVRTYWRAGVPLRQLVWRPYPLDTGHFAPGPDVGSCSSIFAGGAHQRDWSTLARAASVLGRPVVERMVVHTPESVPRPLRSSGEVRLLHFYEAIANSRFVVLPLTNELRKPAGISVISMALAAGRPVIASATPATIDHLRHGYNAILVPPGSPKALAAAIHRLDTDTALLDQLAQGATRAAAGLSVEAWAGVLLDGQPQQATWSMTEDGRGPFYAWPA